MRLYSIFSLFAFLGSNGGGNLKTTHGFLYPRVPRLDLTTIWDPKSVVEWPLKPGDQEYELSSLQGGKTNFVYTGEMHKMNKLWTPKSSYTSSLEDQPPLTFESLLEGQSQLLDSELGLKSNGNGDGQQQGATAVTALPLPDRGTSDYLKYLSQAAQAEKTKILGDATYSPPQVNQVVTDRSKSLEALEKAASAEKMQLLGSDQANPSSTPTKPKKSRAELEQAAIAERNALLGGFDRTTVVRDRDEELKRLKEKANEEKAKILGSASAPIVGAPNVAPVNLQALSEAADVEKAALLGNEPGWTPRDHLANREADQKKLEKKATGERMRLLGTASPYQYNPTVAVVNNREEKLQELLEESMAELYEIFGENVPEPPTKKTSSPVSKEQKLAALKKAAEKERIQVLASKRKSGAGVRTNLQNPLSWMILKIGEIIGLPVDMKKNIRKYGRK